MDYSAYINLNSLTGEARKELESFYEYLIFKYKRNIKKISDIQNSKSKFSAIQLDTKGFKFNREEANCKILYTEDLHHNQLIENKLRILTPFK